MANYKRQAKPVDMWTSADLGGFNIKVIFGTDIQSFFGVSELPTPQHISPVIWSNAVAPAGPMSKEEKTFFALLEDATLTPCCYNAASNDLAYFLLGYLGYDDAPNYVLHTRKELELVVCCKYVDATSDLALLEKEGYYNQYLLLAQQDKDEATQPYAPLIAKAIAAFSHNNAKRPSQSRLNSQTFPAFTMFGTYVTFYKITVTKALADAVVSGIFPEETTFVYAFHPRLNMGTRGAGMVAVENRRVLLKCFEAFKQFVAVPDRQFDH